MLCTESKNGWTVFASHPEDCSKFFICHGLRAFPIDCAAGTLFDKNLKICNHAYLVDCKKEPLKTTTETIKITKETSKTTTELTTTATESTTTTTDPTTTTTKSAMTIAKATTTITQPTTTFTESTTTTTVSTTTTTDPTTTTTKSAMTIAEPTTTTTEPTTTMTESTTTITKPTTNNTEPTETIETTGPLPPCKLDIRFDYPESDITFDTEKCEPTTTTTTESTMTTTKSTAATKEPTTTTIAKTTVTEKAKIEFQEQSLPPCPDESLEASLDSNDYDNDSVPTSWVRQGIMPLPGITCKANKLPPCPKEDSFDLRSGQIHAKIQVIRCHENGKIMTLMVGDILSKAISNFVAEMKISIPDEVIVDIETVTGLAEPKINVGLSSIEGTISASVKLRGDSKQTVKFQVSVPKLLGLIPSINNEALSEIITEKLKTISENIAFLEKLAAEDMTKISLSEIITNAVILNIKQGKSSESTEKLKFNIEFQENIEYPEVEIKAGTPETETNSGEVEDVSEIPCQCQSYKTCAWSKKLVKMASGVEKSSPAWTSYKVFIQDKQCDFEKQNVYCCGKNGTYPTSDELLKLKGGNAGERVKPKERQINVRVPGKNQTIKFQVDVPRKCFDESSSNPKTPSSCIDFSIDNLSLVDIIKMKLEEALVSKSLLDNLANQETKQVTLAEVIANSVAIYLGQNQETDANKLDIQIDTMTGQKFPEIVIKQGGSENELLSDVKIPGAIKVNLTFQVQIPKIPENIDQLVSDITNTFSEMADNSNTYFDNRNNLLASVFREEELLDKMKTPLPPCEIDIRSGLLELDNCDPNLPNLLANQRDSEKIDYNNIDNPVIPVFVKELGTDDEINTTKPPCVDIRSLWSELDNCDPNLPNSFEDFDSEIFGDYRENLLPPLVSMNAELDETFQEEDSFAEDLSKVDYYAYEYLIN